MLSEVHYFLDQAVASGDAVAWRLCYFAVALFLINVDSLLKDHLSLDPSQRERLLAEGFRYGKRGRSYTEQVARVAAGLVGGAGEDRHHTSAVIEELQHQASGIPAEILSEFLSKSTVQSVLFSTAIELEAAAFSLEWLSPNKLSADGAAALAVLADFFGVDRKKVVRHQDQRPA